MFITFEGIDGAGKTTQINLLKSYLERKKKKFVSLREPGGTLLAEKIRSILLDPDIKMPHRSELLLFEAARADLVDNIIKPNLEQGKIVICDRFYDSTTAYQSYGRGLDLDKTIDFHNFTVDGAHPEKTIFLNLTLEESQKRIAEKRKDRMELAGDEFFERVYQGFQELKDKYPERIIEIDGSKSIEDVHKEVVSCLNV
jgi:dTMP kinase